MLRMAIPEVENVRNVITTTVCVLILRGALVQFKASSGIS